MSWGLLRIFFLGERCFFCNRTCLLKFNAYFWYSEHPCFQEEGYNLGCGFPLPGFRSPTHLPLERVSHTNLPPFPGTFRTTIPASNSFTPLAYRRVPIFRRSVLLVDLGMKYRHSWFFSLMFIFWKSWGARGHRFFEKYEPRLPPTGTIKFQAFWYLLMGTTPSPWPRCNSCQFFA